MKLEINPNQVDRTMIGNIAIGQPGDQENWSYKVQLTDKQAIVGFPKFGLIGIAFLVEDSDGNTNKPSGSDAEEIYDWIKENKGDDSISKENSIKAIKMIQRAVKKVKQAESEAVNKKAMEVEPLLIGDNGKIISKKHFKEVTHVSVYGKGKFRRFAIMFGYKESRWKYLFKVGCGYDIKTKSQAMNKSYELLIKHNALGQDSMCFGFMEIHKAKGDGFKIPIAM